MKFNKWTLGLAALGAVSLTSAAQAEEKMNVVQTAVSSTTISGYIDTSMQWNVGTGNENLPGYAFGGSGKADGFNLNVFQLTVAKALDESEWAAGYRADLWFGPDANTLNTASAFLGGVNVPSIQDFAIRQAYVALRTPVGNGIDWKVGVFDTILGYETLESGNNPNMTRSYGFTLEPTTQTGLLATYRFTESIAVTGGVVDTVGPKINARSDTESYKAYTGSVALTAPSDWGWLAGSSLYGGVLVGFDLAANGGAGGTRDNYYVGATVNTPVTGLKAGISFDYVHMWNGASTASIISPALGAPVDNQYAWALYLSYQATEKMSLHGRAETIREQGDVAGSDNEAYALTGTIQYNLWENVISRAEIRWDHGDQDSYGADADLKNAVMVAANIIYKF